MLPPGWEVIRPSTAGLIPRQACPDGPGGDQFARFKEVFR